MTGGGDAPLEGTAILGGSFDPVHIGHLHLLASALRLTRFSPIILVPAALSNFKQDARAAAPAADRLRMLALALEDLREAHGELLSGREVLIDDLEIRKGGVSYTIDTVRAIRQRRGITGRIGLILGDDHLARLGEWEGYDALRRLVVFVFFRRLGGSAVPPEGAVCRFLDNSVVSASATEFRLAADAGGALLSPRVRSYIKEHGLYR